MICGISRIILVLFLVPLTFGLSFQEVLKRDRERVRKVVFKLSNLTGEKYLESGRYALATNVSSLEKLGMSQEELITPGVQGHLDSLEGKKSFYFVFRDCVINTAFREISNCTDFSDPHLSRLVSKIQEANALKKEAQDYFMDKNYSQAYFKYRRLYEYSKLGYIGYDFWPGYAISAFKMGDERDAIAITKMIFRKLDDFNEGKIHDVLKQILAPPEVIQGPTRHLVDITNCPNPNYIKIVGNRYVEKHRFSENLCYDKPRNTIWTPVLH